MENDKLLYAKDTIKAFTDDMEQRGLRTIVIVISDKNVLSRVGGNSTYLCPGLIQFIEKFIHMLSIENRMIFVADLCQKLKTCI